MKKNILFFILFAIISVSTVFSQNLKIAHVDSKVVFDSYKGTKAAQDDYDTQVKKWERQATRMQKTVEEMKQKLEKQSLLLSVKKKKELQERIDVEEKDFQIFVQKIYGREGDLTKKNEEFSKPIIKKIKEVIQEIAKQYDYDLVLDRSAGAVVFWKAEQDFTDKVISELNKE